MQNTTNDNISYLNNILRIKLNISSTISSLDNKGLIQQFCKEKSLSALKVQYKELLLRFKNQMNHHYFTQSIIQLDYEPLITTAVKNDRKAALTLGIYGAKNFIKKPEQDNTIDNILEKLPETNNYYQIINNENIESLKNALINSDFNTHKKQYAVLYGYVTYASIFELNI